MAAAEPPHSSSSGGDHRLPTIAVTFVGALGAGKTSLVVRISSGTFAVAYRPTLSLDFEFATRVKSGQTFSLGLRDTSGEERFASMIPTVVRGCRVLVLVYDVTDPRTVDDMMDRFVKDCEPQLSEHLALVAVVANKVDTLDDAGRAEAQATVDEKVRSIEQRLHDAERAAAVHGFLTSAKSGEGVEALLERAIDEAGPAAAEAAAVPPLVTDAPRGSSGGSGWFARC
ncbi:hypothetical protein FNF27_03408 [Cafeteria roenbergensis]|uniref:Uncharacterized protein n=1 Tax=Cafeteria roenbergensis TaxID=33653 RepID=A0A5A8D7U4_CAFRO|nr:hypothetical protein FNF29_06765 [Cafeteria roenbergensis]KAA0161523.1 hypothetical protein FNF31_03806 [Cafeteria roenbergensis]KAA0169280.1 hypothetical protein FNF28_02234 [Cafeteria roenbergensis]KAA0175110.1 hypothetical protein FNF27_03408 [Cafeteria roenbergensis]|eukprot:KAA0148378.1 hypothetical protein FNF29_06765 [Cafeteria roenbergensis]